MRPHDLVVLLKILSLKEDWQNKDLAATLYISPSEITESLNRSMLARLISPDKKKVLKNALLRFIENGLGFVYPVQPGALVRGIPTAHSAPILREFFSSAEPYVWTAPNGKIRGQAISPLYPNQVLAVQQDETLYNMLALIDAIRVGKVREVQKALEILKALFSMEYA